MERLQIGANLIALGLVSDENADRQHDEAVHNLVREVELDERWNVACPSRTNPKGE